MPKTIRRIDFRTNRRISSGKNTHKLTKGVIHIQLNK